MEPMMKRFVLLILLLNSLAAVENLTLPAINTQLTYTPYDFSNPPPNPPRITITLPGGDNTWLVTEPANGLLYKGPRLFAGDHVGGDGVVDYLLYDNVDTVVSFIYADADASVLDRHYGLCTVRLNSTDAARPDNPGVFDIFLTDAATGAKVSGAAVAMAVPPASPISLTEVGIGQYRTSVLATAARNFAITRSGYNAKLFTTTVTAGVFASFDQTLVDPTPGTVTISNSASNPTGANPIPVRIFFSKPVNQTLGDFTISDLVVSNGTVSSLDGGLQDYTAQVIPTAAGVQVSVPANAVRDGGNIGNAASGTLSVTYDAVGPTVTIDQDPTQTDPATTYPVRFAVHFSEVVTGFAVDDIELSGTAGVPLVPFITGSGADYVVEVSGMSAPGSIIATVRPDAASGASGPSRESSSTDNVVQWSPPANYTLPSKSARLNYSAASDPPTETVDLDLGANAWVVLPPRSLNHTKLMQVVGSASGVEITAAETAVTSTATGRVRIGAKFLQTDTNDFFTYALTPPGTANRQYGFVHLTMVNVSDLALVIGGAYVVLSDGAGNRIRNAAVTYGSSADTGSLLSEITAGVHRLTISNNTTGTIFIRAAGFQDASQVRALSVGSFPEIPFTLTRTNLTPDITTTVGNPTRTKSFPITVDFHTSVTGFDLSDVKVTNGTLSGFVGSGSTYTGTVTAKNAGTLKVEVPSAAATDGALLNDAAALILTYDPKGPLVTINQAVGQADPVTSGAILFTAQFTAPVTGFSGSDISFAGSTATGTLAATVTGSGQTYTVSVNGMVGDGTIVTSVKTDAAVANGHPSAASTSTDNTVTFTPPGVGSPSVTINQDAGQPDPTAANAIIFRVRFSDPVSNFTAGDVLLAGTAPGTLSASVSSVGTAGDEYLVLVGGMTGAGTVIADLAAGAATAQAGSQPSFAATSSDNQVTYAPTGGSSSGPAAASGSGACGLGSGLAALLAACAMTVLARRSLR
jgi:Bacterial Ig-like domain